MVGEPLLALDAAALVHLSHHINNSHKMSLNLCAGSKGASVKIRQKQSQYVTQFMSWF